MIKIFIILLAISNTENAKPSIHRIPPSVLSYVHILKHELRFVQWWIKTQSKNPLIDYIQDTTEPTKERQRAWQINKKLRG